MTVKKTHRKSRRASLKKPLQSLGYSLAQFGPQIQNAGCFRFPQPVEFRYRLNCHHLILLEAGHLEAATPYGPLSAGPGDLICFRPAEKNIYQVAKDTSFYQLAVEFSPPPRQRQTPNLPEFGPLPMRLKTGEYFKDFRKLFESICIELPQSGSVHHFRVQAAIFRLLELMATCVKHSAAPVTPLDSLDHIRLRVSSIEGGNFTDRELARQLGVSVRHFLRLFKQRFGLTPGACRMRARLGEAVRQLRETDISIKVIAYNLGFDGSKGLTRALKKHLGITASDLRHELVAEDEVSSRLIPPSGPYPINRHILPPGDTVDLLLKRDRVQERKI